MFTDVEGSTALRAASGDRAAQPALDAVEVILRAQADLHGGRVIKALGDGLLVTFASPAAAIDCASKMQRALAADETVGLRVRIGLHVGEVLAREDDVHGVAVAVAARLAGRASGGQVLLSDAIRLLAAADPGRRCQPRRAQRFKGVPEPVQVYELDWRRHGQSVPAPKPIPVPTARSTLKRTQSGRGRQPATAPATGVPIIGLCRLPSGSQVAYATTGQGPPVVMVPGWLSHVEKVWTHPAASSARDKLAATHRFVWYDRLGCGLSDRDGFTPSVMNDVEQLEAVLDATGSERCSLIGYSFGGPAAAVFAARHPERVDRLVLYATYARGRALASEEQHESLKALIRANWALGARAFATIFTPNGSPQDLSWFSRFQRHAATAEMAVTLLEEMRNHDARRRLCKSAHRRWCSRTATTPQSIRTTPGR